MSDLTIEAQPRTIVGKKVKDLRRQGILPANIYGSHLVSQPVQLDAHTFSLLERHLPPRAVLTLKVTGEASRQVVIHRTQRDIRTGVPTHLEFLQITTR